MTTPLAEVRAFTSLIHRGSEVTFCGPWLGELGVELVRWLPYLVAATTVASGFDYVLRYNRESAERREAASGGAPPDPGD